jgi:hypothetical protein
VRHDSSAYGSAPSSASVARYWFALGKEPINSPILACKSASWSGRSRSASRTPSATVSGPASSASAVTAPGAARKRLLGEKAGPQQRADVIAHGEW